MKHREPFEFEPNEQVVFVTKGRDMPSFSDVLCISIVLSLLAVPLFVLYYLAWPVTYVVTTTRVLVLRDNDIIDQMRLDDINKFKGTRTALMLHSKKRRMWLPRLTDAWRFETIICKTRAKVNALHTLLS